MHGIVVADRFPLRREWGASNPISHLRAMRYQRVNLERNRLGAYFYNNDLDETGRDDDEDDLGGGGGGARQQLLVDYC